MASGVNIPIKLQDQISTDLDHIRNKLDLLGKAGTSVKFGFLASAGKAAFDMLGRAVDDVGRALGDSIKNASDLQESVSKAGVVFGSSAKEVETFGSTSAKAFGISRQGAYEATSAFGNLFKSIGMTQTKAATMSVDVTKLAADLASFNNVEVDDALLALRSGLVGEAEPMRKFGVLLNEAAVKAMGLRMGLIKVGDTMTEAQKVQARYALIMQQTSDAQGDYARTSDGLANSQRSLNAQLEDLSAKIGTLLLPVVEALVQTASNDLIPALDDAALGMDYLAWSNKKAEQTGVPLAMLWSRIPAIGDAMGASMEDYAVAQNVANNAQREAAAMTAFYTRKAEENGEAMQVWTDVIKKARDAWKALDGSLKADTEYANLPDKITVAANAAKEADKELRKALKSGDEVAIASARIRLRDAQADLAELRREWARLRLEMSKGVTVGETTYHPPNSPYYERRAAGGPVVAGRPYVVGEVGAELFVPNQSGNIIRSGSSGGSSVTVNVAYSPGISTASPAEMDAAARVLGPAIVRELRSRGLLAAGSY